MVIVAPIIIAMLWHQSWCPLRDEDERKCGIYREWTKPQVSEILSECVLLTWVWPCQGLQSSRPMEEWQNLSSPQGETPRGMARPSSVD